jgi:hypothetical protein
LVNFSTKAATLSIGMSTFEGIKEIGFIKERKRNCIIVYVY